jgi:FSR family fosmidomycin resistance protein-like MFS transporter
MVASQISDTQRTRATSVFFMSGQLGLFMGPVLTGLLLGIYGRPGYLILPLLSFTAFMSGWQWLVQKSARTHAEEKVLAAACTEPVEVAVSTPPPTATGRKAILLAIIVLVGSTVSISATNFAPKLFTEMGLSPGTVGWLSGLFMMGSAIGGVVGGTLGDRVAGKWVIILGTLGSILPVYFYIPAEGTARFMLLLLAGFFAGMPHSILVLMVQSLLPRRQAMAAGLALGFMFFSGSVGSYILGIIADSVGLAVALQATAVLPVIAALSALFLPPSR